MNIVTKYYFYQENTNNPLHLNDCYEFIWGYFNTETDAYEALRKLGEMLEYNFDNAVNLELELRKVARVYSGERYYD